MSFIRNKIFLPAKIEPQKRNTIILSLNLNLHDIGKNHCQQLGGVCHFSAIICNLNIMGLIVKCFSADIIFTFVDIFQHSIHSFIHIQFSTRQSVMHVDIFNEVTKTQLAMSHC